MICELCRKEVYKDPIAGWFHRHNHSHECSTQWAVPIEDPKKVTRPQTLHEYPCDCGFC